MKRVPILVLVALLFSVCPAAAVTPGRAHALDPARTGLPFETVTFTSAADSVTLSGWWFDGPAGAPVVVCCPRGRGTMADLLPSVRELSRRGFSVMTFDYRDFGPGGPGATDSLANLVFASRWVQDAVGALRFAKARSGGRPVFAWGQDVGSAVAAAAAARDWKAVDAIAIEGLFRTSLEQVEANGTAQIPGVSRMHRLAVDPRDEPISSVPALRVPLLIVLAGKDAATPPATTRRIAMRSLSIIDTWTIPAAGHDGAELTPGYFDRLAAWFKRIASLLAVPAHK
ncbi:MAG: alpha/beta hydrolase [Candidatus Eisenbacteria bacterium]|nr:alpha/beta hydrolase [Candidatus Eisenbacteria bacterium]